MFIHKINYSTLIDNRVFQNNELHYSAECLAKRILCTKKKLISNVRKNAKKKMWNENFKS